MPVVIPQLRRGGAARSTQRGVSLLIAMIMLVIIGFVSVAVMRNATSSDVVSANARAQTQANQYAQAAERFCESQLGTGTGRVGYIGAGTSGTSWTNFVYWFPSAGAKAHTLSADELSNSSTSIVTPSADTMPQCMFEDTVLSANTYLVTSRGFSLDYRADSKGNTTSGSVVWLQAYVNVQPGP